MKRPFIISIMLFLSAGFLAGQQLVIDRVEPPFWWTGFKSRDLQLLIHAKEIGTASASVNYPGVTVVKVHKTENPDYLFIDLRVESSVSPGKFPLRFARNGATVATYQYELRGRKKNSADRKGFDAGDVIYLLMPDRFANGDTANDNMPGMTERANRTDPGGRHGGDIRGVIDHLDYLTGMGITTVWLNPVQENNMEQYSYHGYSITDYYKVDPRFGTNEDYVELTGVLHEHGIKVIMDMVFNHCGSNHWWMNDLPMQDWLNQFPEFTQTSFRAATVSDRHASVYDIDKFTRGWFVKTMPDLNQHNPFMAKYLIQNSIWWIEYAGLDGIRQDTYPFCFKDFMADWVRAVMLEYPRFNIVGECMTGIPALAAYWQKDALNRDGYNSMLPSLIDFPLADALKAAFVEKDDWNTGVMKIYETIAQDFLYTDPMNLMVLADNHDINRFFDFVGNDIRKMKMAMALVLTTRGIPQIYYGTEILMTTGADKGDGQKRKDFPGGWPGDSLNAFTAGGRTTLQGEMYDFITRLMKWRKVKKVIHEGALKQFVPVGGVYVYFRYDARDTVMVVMNNHDTESRGIDLKNYGEMAGNFTKGREVISGVTINDLKELRVPPKSAAIIEFAAH